MEKKIKMDKRPSINLLGPPILTMVSMLIIMTVFETGKHLFFMNITMWESHLLTIVFSAVVATITSYFVVDKIQSLNQKVETLSGILPICASCKNIRDDKGHWNQIESYISKHSETKFSHGICPVCLKKLYPEL
jgi:hypothetical protein